jgi:hypothetical protein
MHPNVRQLAELLHHYMNKDAPDILEDLPDCQWFEFSVYILVENGEPIRIYNPSLIPIADEDGEDNGR